METCLICNRQSELVYESFRGYQQGSEYDIYYCGNCDASYASPLAVDSAIYNTIYLKAKFLPGYDRYYRFAEDVLKVNNPLEYLSETEDTYWAISNYVGTQQVTPNPRILEVGCGLGYLTYALVKAGYNAKGIDISHKAIEEATKKYGNYYEYADVFEYKGCIKDKFDIILLTEVIEHVPDPVKFVSALKELLSNNGRIVITTPNKDIAITQERYWDTELPPVHLWWLSKRSFQILSNKLGFNVNFADFTPYQSKIRHKRVYNPPWRQQTLDTDGNILFKVPFNSTRSAIRRHLINYGLLRKWQLIKNIALGKPKGRDNLSISNCLCAILNIRDE